MSYKNEIKQANFELEELRHLVHGGKEEYEEVRKIYEIMFKDPIVRYQHLEGELPREERIIRNWKRVPRIRELIQKHNLRKPDYLNYGPYGISNNGVYTMSVHHGMFEAIINILGSPEQVEKYHQKALDEEIIGCYAQTEMGHGSDVQGLMTTATFDKENQEFILNTPDIKAIKFWPGDLGLVANHAMVFARLIIDDEDYGVNVFLARIRDEVTHRPLKGVEVGDIGPKCGYTVKDNGYLAFNNVRIPRQAILSRYVNVTPDGMITLQGNPKIAYGTMLLIRVTLLKFSKEASLYSLFFTAKYLLFRTQFKNIPGSNAERKLIDYQATQHRLVKILGVTYANVFAFNKCFKIYNQMREEIKNDEFGLMKELHSLCCCFKAYFMEECLENLKITRELCGAHGYSVHSGFEFLFEVKSPSVTLEGDAFVMFQQTARDIFKHMGRITKGKIAKQDFEYLNDINTIVGKKLENPDLSDINVLFGILRASALFQYIRTSKLLKKDNNIPYDEKWNKIHLLDIVKCAKLHSVVKSAEIMYGEIMDSKLSKGLTQNLLTLCKIYACDCILKYNEEAQLNNYISSDTIFEVSEYLDKLIFEIRPQIVGLIEGARVHEGHNFSLLAPDDGKVYEGMYENATNTRLNHNDKLEAMETSVKPLRRLLIAKL